MLASARRAIQYPNPDRSDRPDVPAHILNLVNALEIDVVYAQGTHAARPANPGLATGGYVYWETDTNLLFYWNGAAYTQIGITAAGVNFKGTYAARPAANTVGAGVTYSATDTLGVWISDGAVWTLIQQGVPLVTVTNFALAPFSTPYDGQMVALEVDATNGIKWHFRYNSGSASAYKWEFLGGPEMFSSVETSETTSSATAVDLSTVGPTFTAPRAGDYTLQFTDEWGNNVAGSSVYTLMYVSGAEQFRIAPVAQQSNSSYLIDSGSVVRLAAVAASAVIKLMYAVSGGNGAYSKRRAILRPVRIS